MNFEEEIHKKREELASLESALSDPSVFNDAARLKKIGQEFTAVKAVVELADEWERLHRECKHTERMMSDEDASVREMAEGEVALLREKISAVEVRLMEALRPADPLDRNSIIMEIRAGTGGDEAALFASELFRLYSRFAERNNWDVHILSSNQNDLGGFKEIIFEVNGTGVYSVLKFESGVHRVQRVPETEKAGRVHTSTVTVAVLPQMEETDVAIDPKDVKLETTTSGGHGGQSVNTTYSAVRLTHLPTGIVVQCQDERSQTQNKAKAFAVLRARVFALTREKQAAERSEERRSQIGTGERSEKIRTYNFPQDRLTDHRLDENFHNLPAIMEGQMDQVIAALKRKESETST